MSSEGQRTLITGKTRSGRHFRANNLHSTPAQQNQSARNRTNPFLDTEFNGLGFDDTNRPSEATNAINHNLEDLSLNIQNSDHSNGSAHLGPQSRNLLATLLVHMQQMEERLTERFERRITELNQRQDNNIVALERQVREHAVEMEGRLTARTGVFLDVLNGHVIPRQEETVRNMNALSRQSEELRARSTELKNLVEANDRKLEELKETTLTSLEFRLDQKIEHLAGTVVCRVDALHIDTERQAEQLGERVVQWLNDNGMVEDTCSRRVQDLSRTLDLTAKNPGLTSPVVQMPVPVAMSSVPVRQTYVPGTQENLKILKFKTGQSAKEWVRNFKCQAKFARVIPVTEWPRVMGKHMDFDHWKI